MAAQITVPPEQPGRREREKDGAAPGQVPPPCARRCRRRITGPAGAHRWPRGGWRARSGRRSPAPGVTPGMERGPNLIRPPLCRANSPRRRADGLLPSPGSPNVPDAWQARDAPGPLWLPYVFNKIRQIGPGDRDCSKAVIKQHKPGQCKRQQGPSWKGRWVPAPHRAARPGVSGSPQRCPRRFLSRSW